MKQTLLHISAFFLIYNASLYADVNSFDIDNDYFVGKDGHYTNGLFYTWMADSNNSIDFSFINNLETNNAISFSHLIFTPQDTEQTTPIYNDLPYAGYAQLNFLLYKSTKNYFHEFGINIGIVGPATGAQELQSGFHELINNQTPKGWSTQLKNQPTAGISYNFAKKTDKIDIYGLKFDWINNIRGDIGNFYSGALIATTVRIGSNFPDTFPTTGNFIGGEESNNLHFHASKSFNWSLAFGVFANKVWNYYIVDEARDEGYTIPRINYIIGNQLICTVFYDNIRYAFKLKSINIYKNSPPNTSKQWGGLTITLRF
jgi:hypothetical protein